MKKYTRLGLISLTFLAALSAGHAALHPHAASGGPTPAPAHPVSLHLSVEKETASETQGKPTVSWAALVGDVHPGDLLRYRVEARNAGKAAVSDLVVTQPVPAGSAYVVHSAEGDAAGGASLTYSLDGKRFAAQPMRVVTDADGVAKTVPALPESYAALRWRFPTLAGGTSQGVTYQVRVR